MTLEHLGPDLRQQLEHARWLESGGQVLQAESGYIALLRQWPGCAEASMRLAQLALRRGDAMRAIEVLQVAFRLNSANAQIAVELAVLLAHGERLSEAIETLEAALRDSPSDCTAWLLLGQLREASGDASAALKAWFQAVTRAQRAGLWTSQATTPPQMLEPVVRAIEQVRLGRRELFFGAYDVLRQQHGAGALVRVERALTGYLHDWDSTPTDPRQRPKFFFFPDLPNTPFHDPYLQPWAEGLCAAFPRIRADALRVLEEDRRLPNFIPANSRVEDFVSGDGPAPSWEAFFFYRHGERYDANHRRCPDTSEAIESIDLCRIADQAPEILFSVLKPGSHINAHHGVTNVRLVMHLPLVVPQDCALNLVDRGEHRWEEGRPVMFDDTYLHEAWNRSRGTRIVLLMDCWNPHLNALERLAVKELIETISGLNEADRATKRAAA